ncbi:MAG: sensor histidine kinase [Gemmatimonadaceae bacterium]
MTTSSTHAPPHAESRRSLALQWLLPLLITAVVAVVLVTGLILSSAMLRRTALSSTRNLLDRGVRQLASVAATGVQQARPRYLAATHDGALRQLLHGDRSRATTDTVLRTLGHLTTANDSGMPVELWSADGRRVAFVGRDVPAAIDARQRPEIPDQSTVRREGLGAIGNIDSLQLGTLYASDNRVYFWLVAPVMEGAHAAGYILQQRRLAASPQTNRTLQELTGTPITVSYGNVDRRFWSTIGGRPEPDPTGSSEMIESDVPIAGTPLMMALATPRAAVLAAPDALIRRLAVLAFALTVAGAILAWFVGRRVARPILRLTTAAESVARGDYGTRVPLAGPEEVSRLAVSFNEMSRRIGEASARLAESEAELRAVAESAQTANRAKSDFLATMSHELRTPLNAIGGYVDLLTLGLRGPITDAQQRDFERIRTNQEHLLGLIGGVLDLSRIESGRLVYQVEPIAIDPLLSGLDALVGPQAESKALSLEYTRAPSDLIVMADREKLRQILLNLLSNAIRHTPSGGRVIMGAVTAGASVEISVRDDGPGIPLDKQSAIFEPFVQLDRSLTQLREGVGLGLSISRDLAVAMGGGLVVSSTPGAGACFTVSLPRGMDQVLAFRETGELQSPTT